VLALVQYLLLVMGFSFVMQPAMSAWNAASTWGWGDSGVGCFFQTHTKQVWFTSTTIATVCKTVEKHSILYVQELVEQLNSPQNIHIREFKYNSCGQTDTTFTMEIESMSQHCWLSSAI
jgi:hypothetical protein